ncbi:hypothetical protein HN51_052575 [Arachis hypogaea]
MILLLLKLKLDVEAVARARRYLKEFEYLQEQDHADFEGAIKKFQKYYTLKVSEKLIRKPIIRETSPTVLTHQFFDVSLNVSGNGEHGDGVPFDKIIVAHAFPPIDGRLHVNADKDWSIKDPIQEDKNIHTGDTCDLV